MPTFGILTDQASKCSSYSCKPEPYGQSHPHLVLGVEKSIVKRDHGTESGFEYPEEESSSEEPLKVERRCLRCVNIFRAKRRRHTCNVDANPHPIVAHPIQILGLNNLEVTTAGI